MAYTAPQDVTVGASRDTACVDCPHPYSVHAWPLGCMSGWAYDGHGNAVTQGCTCKLAHVDLSPTERR